MKNLIAIGAFCALFALPAMAQDKAPAEGEEVATEAVTTEEVDAAVETIDGVAEDQAKADGYCAIYKEMEAAPESDEAKAEELSTKMDTYIAGLGEDVADAFALVDTVDPETEDGAKLEEAIGALDEKCAS